MERSIAKGWRSALARHPPPTRPPSPQHRPRVAPTADSPKRASAEHVETRLRFALAHNRKPRGRRGWRHPLRGPELAFFSNGLSSATPETRARVPEPAHRRWERDSVRDPRSRLPWASRLLLGGPHSAQLLHVSTESPSRLARGTNTSHTAPAAPAVAERWRPVFLRRTADRSCGNACLGSTAATRRE
jgi:hypothetical protein